MPRHLAAWSVSGLGLRRPPRRSRRRLSAALRGGAAPGVRPHRGGADRHHDRARPEPMPGSIGPPLPGVEVPPRRPVDGHDVLVGDPARSGCVDPNVFPGYWNDDEATKRVLTGDGWLRTGDIAVAYADGELVLVDRPGQGPRDRFGLQRLPGRSGGSARRSSRCRRGRGRGRTEPHARARRWWPSWWPKRGAVPIPRELRGFAARRLARYKCPTRVEVVDELPRGPIGKVLRRELRDDTANPA